MEDDGRDTTVDGQLLVERLTVLLHDVFEFFLTEVHDFVLVGMYESDELVAPLDDDKMLQIY